MKTPNLDREINDLSYYETNNELTDQGRNTIAEFREIKEQLSLHSVSSHREQLIAFAEWKEYNGKWQTHEEQVKNFLKEYKSN